MADIVDNTQYFGQTDPTTGSGDWNRQRFLIQQQMAKLNTSMPVRVTAVSAGGVSPVGFVSVRILVDEITGNDMAIPHDDIVNVPYMRLQGGANAVIIDPEVGDIGMGCFCSRDISSVKNVRKNAPPGSRRMYDFSDCMYVGGFLNAAPAQYVQFTAGGIIIHSPTKVRAEAPIVQLDGSTAVQLGDVEATLRRIIDERLIALYNAHTHTSGGAGVPVTPLTLATVATAITQAN